MSESNMTREAMAKEVRGWLAKFNDDRLSLRDLITDLVKDARALARRDALLREAHCYIVAQSRAPYSLAERIERELGDSHD